MNYDLVIKDGKIIDGTGNPWYKADLGIKGGKIAKIGHLNAGTENEIDATGNVITPGFIDLHNHSEMTIMFNNKLESMVHQGVTTIIGGNCGNSAAPVNPNTKELLEKTVAFFIPVPVEIDLPWITFNEYLSTIENLKVSPNFGFLVGHGTLRIAAMGGDMRDPTPTELETMKSHAREAMEAGAFGLSSGLIYPPGSYAKTRELIELVHVIAEYEGCYFSHIRNESDRLIEALEEAVEIGETCNVPVQIAHLKVSGKHNWGKSKEMLHLLDEVNARGLQVTGDQYPYIAGSTTLVSIYPQWAQEGGIQGLLERLQDQEILNRLRNEMEGMTWENIMVGVVKTEKNKEVEGKRLHEIAKLRETDPFTSTKDLVLEESGEATMIGFGMDEEDVKRIMKHPYTCVGSDGWAHALHGILSNGKPHPRCYGAFPRVLGLYVRQEGVMTLQEAIRKMTSFPALKIGLQDRGLLREGCWADIVIFDDSKIIDKATFQNPHAYPDGIHSVLINGELVVENKEHTGALPGKILRHHS